MTHSGLGDSYFQSWQRFGPPALPPPRALPPPATGQRSRPPRAVGVLGHFTSVLILLVAVASGFYAWTSWNLHAVVSDVFSRPLDFTEEEAFGRAEAAYNVGLISVWLYFAVAVVAAAAFIAWLWRARRNSEVLSDGLHTRARGWVIGGWFVPIVSWWFPYQVVRDIWRATDPATRMLDGELRLARGGRPVSLWWTCWVVTSVASVMSLRQARNEPSDAGNVDDFLRWIKLGAVYDTASTVFEILAAILLVLIIRRISRWQETPAPAAPRDD